MEQQINNFFLAFYLYAFIIDKIFGEDIRFINHYRGR